MKNKRKKRYWTGRSGNLIASYLYQRENEMEIKYQTWQCKHFEKFYVLVARVIFRPARPHIGAHAQVVVAVSAGRGQELAGDSVVFAVRQPRLRSG